MSYDQGVSHNSRIERKNNSNKRDSMSKKSQNQRCNKNMYNCSNTSNVFSVPGTKNLTPKKYHQSHLQKKHRSKLGLLQLSPLCTQLSVFSKKHEDDYKRADNLFDFADDEDWAHHYGFFTEWDLCLLKDEEDEVQRYVRVNPFANGEYSSSDDDDYC
jgi:hypothetical protein